ncbi:hypothetical protein QW180_08545 [Vibrio sinaloensis]|nr:hypothetical protein [Vibrio sinaloensis]
MNKFVQVDLRCFNKLPALLLNSYCYLDETVDPEKYFINACILVSLKPEIYDSVVRQMEEIDISNGSEYSRIIKDLFFVLCYEYRINFVNYLIEIGQFDRAESLLYAMSRADSEDDIKTIVTYSKLSSLRGDFTRSLSILRSYLNTKYSFPVAKEYLRILNSTGNFNESNLVIERMIENGDDVAPALKMPILQSEGKIGEAYSKYMEFSGRLTLNKFIPDKVLKIHAPKRPKRYSRFLHMVLEMKFDSAQYIARLLNTLMMLFFLVVMRD